MKVVLPYATNGTGKTTFTHPLVQVQGTGRPPWYLKRGNSLYPLLTPKRAIKSPICRGNGGVLPVVKVGRDIVGIFEFFHKIGEKLVESSARSLTAVRFNGCMKVYNSQCFRVC